MDLRQIIKEEYKAVINERKEMISYHIDNKVPFSENVYRVGSNNYFTVIREARRLYKAGKLQVLNEEDQDLFENSDLGEWAMFGGERVPLDFPMYVETLEEAKKKKKKKDPPIGKPMKNSGSGKKYKVYRGMASVEAQVDWRGQARSLEGISTTIPYKGSVVKILQDLEQNIRSGLSYSGADCLYDLWYNAKFIRQTQAGMKESFTHILTR